MSKISTPPTIRELKPTELGLMFPLIHANNPSLSRPLFTRRLKTMKSLGYRAIGVFHGKKLIGCSGFWLRTRFWDGNELDIDNFYVAAEYRNQQIGAQMVAWLETYAINHKIDLMVLDTYADYFLAQRFYVRAGFVHTGYHMTKIPGSKTPFSRKQS